MIFYFGTGLGAGLILDGRFTEEPIYNSEVGYIRLASDGPVGYGKAGSFEGFCVVEALHSWPERLYPG